ncbi:MAG: hypothetical protein K2G96_05350, partial [Clostridia bacterium]|nr:hypothetical protein [Clostridia bacterium]
MENNEIKQDDKFQCEESCAASATAASADGAENAGQSSAEGVISNEVLAKLINSWFVNIRNVIRTVKEKDANLYKMNGELQAYRNDYSRQLFKSLAQYLINFREDCAKSLRDAEEYELKREAVIKYIGYVADEYETLLENLGIEIDGETVKLNGTEITSKPSETTVFSVNTSVEEDSAPVVQADGAYTQQEVVQLLSDRTEEIKAILKDNAALDIVVGEYIKQSKLIERNEQQIVLYPVIRLLVNYFNNIKKDIAEATADSGAELSVLTVAY